MRLNVKNFETHNRKIVWKQNGMFLNVFYFKKVAGCLQFDRVFFEVLEPGDNLKEKLVNQFRRIEKHYGIELLKPDFKIEQTQLN
jgi:hypothetical protein